jgi:SAM-dependent methyltransferase
MNPSTERMLPGKTACVERCALAGAPLRGSPSCLSDIWKAPLHDFPIRDEILYQYLPLSTGMDVLEIGPGSGYTSFQLARHVRHLTLVDVAEENIKQLHDETFRKVPNVMLVHADVCTPDLARSLWLQFDAIFGLEVFQLLPDPGECLKNLAALLRHKGILLLAFPNYPPRKNSGIKHFKSRAELDRLLQSAGFASWEFYALKLRPHAQVLFHYFHERPLRILRFLRLGSHRRQAMTHGQTEAFQQRRNLAVAKYMLHPFWALLSLAIRGGGECFESAGIEQEILNHDLLLLARR